MFQNSLERNCEMKLTSDFGKAGNNSWDPGESHDDGESSKELEIRRGCALPRLIISDRVDDPRCPRVQTQVGQHDEAQWCHHEDEDGESVLYPAIRTSVSRRQHCLCSRQIESQWDWNQNCGNGPRSQGIHTESPPFLALESHNSQESRRWQRNHT